MLKQVLVEVRLPSFPRHWVEVQRFCRRAAPDLLSSIETDLPLSFSCEYVHMERCSDTDAHEKSIGHEDARHCTSSSASCIDRLRLSAYISYEDDSTRHTYSSDMAPRWSASVAGLLD